MPATGIPVEPPIQGAPPQAPGAEGKDSGRGRRYAVAGGFLIPALVFLGVWIVYPTVYTIVRSLYDADGTAFVGVENYRTLFTTSVLLTAIKNNAIWVLVVPALVTGLLAYLKGLKTPVPVKKPRKPKFGDQ